jgi:hypothetical protein
VCTSAALYDGQNMYWLLQVGAGRMIMVWYLSVSHIAFSFFAAAAMIDRRAEGPTMEGAGSALTTGYTSTSGTGGDLEGWLTRSGIALPRTGPQSILPRGCCMLGGWLAAATLRKAGLQGMARVHCPGHHPDRRPLQSLNTGLLGVSSRYAMSAELRLKRPAVCGATQSGHSRPLLFDKGFCAGMT